MNIMPMGEKAISATSWWLDDALAAEGNVPSCAPLSGALNVDVAIVGGGFTGLWTALALNERSPALSVALIERTICGAEASGKNGGKCHGYWSSLSGAIKNLGSQGALEISRAASRAQDGIRKFAIESGYDIHWREGGHFRASSCNAQDGSIARCVEAARELGVPDKAVALTAAEVQALCASPVYRGGVYFPEGATVHPARLARALRAEALKRGIRIYENTAMQRLENGNPNRITTANGEIVAKHVVLATNTGLATHPAIKSHMSVFSSFALMTDPAEEELKRMKWTGKEGISDARMFVHYFRKTDDHRVLMGSGSGPIAYGGRDDLDKLRYDEAAAGRAVAGLRRLLPGLNGVGVAKIWGGPIDVSADRLPFFKTLPATHVHYGCGFSGHGVNATYIAGQCLASLVLNAKDEWSSLPFCTREVPNLPPEPFRYLGAMAIRRAVMQCEAAEEKELRAPAFARAVSALPKIFNLRIGTR